ncbi:MAG: hypothetical protein GYB68_19835, partial [Chloroflexi bacterium]|nr:hypothetical protein [Chloroflexota bacterium]
RQYHRMLVFYNPLHAAAITAARQITTGWVDAYTLVSGLGLVVISAGVVALLMAIWGPGPTGLTLLLLTGFIFPNQGLHYAVPGNITLGLAMLLWGHLLFRRQINPWIMLLVSTTLVLTHTVGRIYMLVALALVWLMAQRPLKAETWWTLVAGTAPILGLTLLAQLLPWPELTVLPQPIPPDWTFSSHVTDNLSATLSTVSTAVRSFGSLVMILPLSMIGFLTMAGEPRRRFIFMFGMLGGPLLLTPFYTGLSTYPGVLFARLWIVPVLLVVGLMARGLWQVIASIPAWVKEPRQTLRWAGMNSPAWVALIAGLGLIIGISAARVDQASTTLQPIPAMGRSIDDSRIDLTQVDLITQDNDRCQRILYDDELVLYAFLINGADDCGAVLNDMVMGSAEQDDWINADLTTLVTRSPLRRLEGEYQGDLEIRPDLPIRIEQSEAGPLGLALRNTGPAVDLNIEDGTGERSTLMIEASWSGNVELDLPPPLQISVTGPLWLVGLASQPDAALRWPWASSITLTQDGRTVYFNPAEFDIQSNLPCHRIDVLADDGSTLVAALRYTCE